MITLEDFSMGFQNCILLDRVNAVFPANKLTALIGRNGSGKSTLMRTICGLNKSYKGNILIDGVNIKDISPKQFSKIISYVNTQRPRIANLKCKEVVALGRSPYTTWHGQISENDKKIIREAINIVGMNEYADRYFLNLSDGEAQKIMIARAIAQDTKIIILDEPTSFLDLPTRFELGELLIKLIKEQNKTIIFSTHELDLALKFANFISLISDKKLIILPKPELEKSDYLTTTFGL